MFKRHRKLRKNEVIRNLVKDVYVSKEDLIYPIFIEEGENIKNEILQCQEFLDTLLTGFLKNWMNW